MGYACKLNNSNDSNIAVSTISACDKSYSRGGMYGGHRISYTNSPNRFVLEADYVENTRTLSSRITILKSGMYQIYMNFTKSGYVTIYLQIIKNGTTITPSSWPTQEVLSPNDSLYIYVDTTYKSTRTYNFGAVIVYASLK